MEPLKLVALTVNGEFYNSSIKLEDIKADETGYSSWWYLHGELEYLVGYDKAVPINCKSTGNTVDTINWSSISGNKVTDVFDDTLRPAMHINGIIPVEIEGIDKPCVGYFWTTSEKPIYWKDKEYRYWEQRGLVCFADDKQACDFALAKYNSKTTML